MVKVSASLNTRKGCFNHVPPSLLKSRKYTFGAEPIAPQSTVHLRNGCRNHFAGVLWVIVLAVRFLYMSAALHTDAEVPSTWNRITKINHGALGNLSIEVEPRHVKPSIKARSNVTYCIPKHSALVNKPSHSSGNDFARYGSLLPLAQGFRDFYSREVSYAELEQMVLPLAD